jgi:3-oxoacyl-[acyl-carrier protein] reductase
MVALVTGAGRGEGGGGGAGIARALARHGAQVVVNDLTGESVAATVAQIERRGGLAWGITGDVANSRDAERMVAAVVERFGQIDILVNNAALGGLVPASERLPDETWLRQVAVDLSGPFFMSRAAVRYMLPRRFGRIVNIGSLAGVRTGFVSGAPYTTAKSGLIGLTRQMAFELAPFGITVNVLLPTGIRNPEIMRRRPDLFQETQLGPLDPEEELGKLVAFLARPDVGFLSGAAIPVDRGLGSALGNFVAYARRSGKDIG